MCKAWAAAWALLVRRRHYLNPAPLRVLELPVAEGEGDLVFSFAVMPDKALCVRSAALTMHFFSPAGESLEDDSHWDALRVAADGHPTGVVRWRDDGLDWHAAGMLVHDEALFISTGRSSKNGDGYVVKLRLGDGLELARSQLMDQPTSMAIAGDCLVVGAADERVQLLDMRTLAPRGVSFRCRIDCIQDIAVCGDELVLACDFCPIVTTLQGEPLRDLLHVRHPALETVTRGARQITAHGTSLYIIEKTKDSEEALLWSGYEDPEDPEEEEDEDYEETRKEVELELEQFPEQAGRRIAVLGLDGTLLQYVNLPDFSDGDWPHLAMRWHDGELYVLNLRDSLETQTLRCVVMGTR